MLYEKYSAMVEFRGNSAADFPVVETGTSATGDTVTKLNRDLLLIRAPGVCLALKESLQLLLV